MTKFKTLGGGVGIIALTWGCSSNVQIGYGNAGGQGGSESGGSAGLAEGGSISTGGSKAGAGAGGSVSVGAGGSAGTGGETGFPLNPPQQNADKLDLLFVVDNSISMGHHQALLAQSVGSFLRRLENPLCLEANGTPSSTQPASPADSCPAGAEREFSAVRDVHIGVITSSLGARAGQICAEAGGDDRAELLPSVRPGLDSYNGTGFLKWDPAGNGSPPGEADVNVVAADLSAHIAAANAQGCGFENTFEAWYQFLIDPEPTTNIVQLNNESVPMGINQVVLDQRAAFLRPDSAVAVIVLSDENDCSIRGDSVGWLIGLTQAGGSQFRMPRSTQACQTDINSPCCRSCATAELEPPPGCTTTVGAGSNDPECLKNGGNLDNSLNEDQLNLRCFDQKRRFGFDLLYPIERYTAGLAHKTVPNRQGEQVRNPLFTTTRNPTLINFALIAGVPWQNISADPPGDDISYLSAAELTSQGRWQLILGDPANGVQPSDPLMRETPNERTGTSPLIGAALVPSSSQDPTANPANGHEQTNLYNDDLQYSCIYELPEPIVCDNGACECTGHEDRNRPICQPPEGGPAGSTQYYAKAYPPTRGLALARSLGKQAVLGSICPRNAADAVAPDYAYSAEFNSLARRLGVMLVE